MASASLALPELAAPAARADRGFSRSFEFAESGWDRGWRSSGVANLRTAGGEGLLEAGSDVFPNDPRPVAFLGDHRFRDGSISALVSRPGAGPGVVLRRRSPSAFYAAIYDTESLALVILSRSGMDLRRLASAPVALAVAPLALSLEVSGSHPTTLVAALADASGLRVRASAEDATEGLQRDGDAGVLATARTLLPSGNAVLPALGNLHLLPYGVQEGEVVLQTPVGKALVGAIAERSTVAFRRIEIRSRQQPRPSPASVVAATTGPPVAGGARLHVASDLPARVTIELSRSRSFAHSRRRGAGRTDEFNAVVREVADLVPGSRIYWRARLRRRGVESVGRARSFRVLPAAGDPKPVRIAVCACAAQFGPIFDQLAAVRPDALVWHGDLNYPDTHGPLAQTVSAYAGIWRDFLANPRLLPVLESAAFAAQRDDHDYGVQDANSGRLPPWGIGPWESLMGDRLYFRFAAGHAEVWVLDQRRHKTDPTRPDGPGKTLLGARQRRWLLSTLRESKAAFKLICSPCTLFMEGNARDGSWATGFAAERDRILAHVDRQVSGRVLFLTGDTHLTGVYDSGGRYEARAAPLDIPTPNDITLLNPFAASSLRSAAGVSYADDRGHFTLLDIGTADGKPKLELTLVRADGSRPYSRRFPLSITA